MHPPPRLQPDCTVPFLFTVFLRCCLGCVVVLHGSRYHRAMQTCSGSGGRERKKEKRKCLVPVAQVALTIALYQVRRRQRTCVQRIKKRQAGAVLRTGGKVGNQTLEILRQGVLLLQHRIANLIVILPQPTYGCPLAHIVKTRRRSTFTRAQLDKYKLILSRKPDHFLVATGASLRNSGYNSIRFPLHTERARGELCFKCEVTTKTNKRRRTAVATHTARPTSP